MTFIHLRDHQDVREDDGSIKWESSEWLKQKIETVLKLIML